MDARATQTTARSVNQAIRRDFFDRYNGVMVKESVAFGHPTTQRMFRRTFTVAAKNFYFAAVVAPMLRSEDSTALPLLADCAPFRRL